MQMVLANCLALISHACWQGVEGANDRLSDDNKAMEDIEEAARRATTAKKQFDRLRDVCISAQQVSGCGVRP